MSDHEHEPPEDEGPDAEVVDMAELMGGRIRAFAARPISDADMLRLLDQMIREQAQIEAQMFPTVFDIEQRLMHSEWGMEISSPNASHLRAGVSALKLIQDVFALPPEQQADAALRAVSILALLTDGLTARAVLKVFGFQYRFIQHKGTQRRIIT